MTRMQFQAAQIVEEDEELAEGEEAPAPKILEFSIAGQDFESLVPTTTQIILLSTAGGSDGGTMRSMVAASMEFLEGILQGDGYRRLRKLVANGTIGYDLLLGGDDANEQGIIDWIVDQVSVGRPIRQPSDYAQSQKPGGTKSKGNSSGRAPGKGSKL